MSEFFFEYGLFFAKILTIVIAIVVIIGFAAAAGRRAHHEGLEVENLNKKYQSLAQEGRAKERGERG
jgi:serine protease SohB